MMLEKGRFPVTTASFVKIRQRDMYYVDKTEMVWQLANTMDVVFLSRPRRFGKSMLLRTMASYLGGERELFEGLKLEPLEEARGEKAWTKHPVLHFDFSALMPCSPEGMESMVQERLILAYRKYGIAAPANGAPIPFSLAIRELEAAAQAPVAVLVDEYDAPILQALSQGDDELLEATKQYLQGFYKTLKAADDSLRFLMVTGISQVRQIGLFSGFNNIRDISFSPQYSAICGFSETEIREYLAGALDRMADTLGIGPEELMATLKHKYDGYRFAPRGEDVYNPFGLMNALMDCELYDYWSEMGTASSAAILIPRYDALGLVNITGPIAASRANLSRFDYDRGDPVPFLYQTGYLTIKGTTEEGIFLLDFPNLEVRQSIMLLLAPKTLGIRSDIAYHGLQRNLVRALNGDDIHALQACIQAFLSSLPFDAEDDDAAKTWELRECRYRDAVHLVFAGARSDARVEQLSAEGISDVEIIGQRMVVVMELKMARDGNTAEKALAQAKCYTARHLGGEMPVWAVGAVIGKRARITWAEELVWEGE